MRCNNRDDLLQLSLTLKISIFSEAFGTRKIPPWSIPPPPQVSCPPVNSHLVKFPDPKPNPTPNKNPDTGGDSLGAIYRRGGGGGWPGGNSLGVIYWGEFDGGDSPREEFSGHPF